MHRKWSSNSRRARLPEAPHQHCCKPRAEEGKNFITYVKYLADKGFVPPHGKGWVDHIRTKGNEANHEIALMHAADAEELLMFTEIAPQVHIRISQPGSGTTSLPAAGQPIDPSEAKPRTLCKVGSNAGALGRLQAVRRSEGAGADGNG